MKMRGGVCCLVSCSYSVRSRLTEEVGLTVRVVSQGDCRRINSLDGWEKDKYRGRGGITEPQTFDEESIRFAASAEFCFAKELNGASTAYGRWPSAELSVSGCLDCNVNRSRIGAMCLPFIPDLQNH